MSRKDCDTTLINSDEVELETLLNKLSKRDHQPKRDSDKSLIKLQKEIKVRKQKAANQKQALMAKALNDNFFSDQELEAERLLLLESRDLKSFMDLVNSEINDFNELLSKMELQDGREIENCIAKSKRTQEAVVSREMGRVKMIFDPKRIAECIQSLCCE